MANARVEEEIKKDEISEENLLLQEDKSKNTIIRNANFKSNNADSKSKRQGEKEKPKGEKEEEPRGEKEKKRGEEEKSEEETPADRSKHDDNDYRMFGLCRSGQCLSHFSCRDPLLYDTNVCDRLTNLLQIRRRYHMCELILKILTMAILLSCTAMVFYSWGKTRCELKERQEAIIMKAPNISVTAKGNSTMKAKVKDTFHNDDEDEEEAIVNKDQKGLAKGTHRATKGREQDQNQNDQEDFTFDEDVDSDDDDKEKDTDDETKSLKPIVISFWPK